MNGYMTIRKAAKAGIAPETMIRRLVAEGKCPGVYSGKRFYVNVKLLQEKLQQSSKNSNEK